MKNYIILDNAENIEKVISSCSKKYGVPEFHLQLGAFMSTDDKGFKLSLKTRGEKWKVDFPNKKFMKDREKFVFSAIYTKSFFNFLKHFDVLDGEFGLRKIYEYKICSKQILNITYDDFIGWSIEIISHNKVKEIEDLLKGIKYKLMDQDERKKYLKYVKIKLNANKNLLYNRRLNVLGNTFIENCQKLGLHYTKTPHTLLDLINNKTNDYSFYESAYDMVTNKALLGRDSVSKYYKISPLTIVICSYNSNETVVKTLMSIASQNLSLQERKMLEIIVVDDSSSVPVKEKLARYKKDLGDFDLKVIRVEKNIGSKKARNIGLFLARNDIVLFVDSDILLPENYIREMACRIKMFPNSAFVSFKKNVNKSDRLCQYKNIKAGLPIPEISDDWRLETLVKSGQIGHVTSKYTRTVNILEDSNYFKNLGLGKVIGVYSIDSMLVGHNFIVRKNMVLSPSLQDDCEFRGWGLEDSYIGSMIIANGGFIIPVLSTGVYHINHPPRSGTQKRKFSEFRKNLSRYKNYLKKKLV